MRSNLLVYGAVAAALLAEAPAFWPPPFVTTDHLLLWNVGRTVATGGSPYLTETWTDAAIRYGSPHIQDILDHGAAVWPYPPWTGYLFVPFGLLPVEVGPWVLHATYIAAGLVAAVAFARTMTWRSTSAFAAALVAFVAFQPFVIAARWGQFSSFSLAAVALLYIGLRSGRATPIAVGALLIAAKPQFALLLGPIALGLLVTRRLTRTIVLVTTILLAVGTLTWLRYPEWLDAATSGSVVRLGLARIFPSTWSFAAAIADDRWLPIGVALVLAVFVCAFFAVRWTPPSFRLLTGLSAALLATVAALPYLYTYDHLVLAPVLFVGLQAWDRSEGAARVVHTILVVMLGVFVPWSAFFIALSTAEPAVSGVVPIFFALLLVASAALLRRSAAVRAPAPTADEERPGGPGTLAGESQPAFAERIEPDPLRET